MFISVQKIIDFWYIDLISHIIKLTFCRFYQIFLQRPPHSLWIRQLYFFLSYLLSFTSFSCLTVVRVNIHVLLLVLEENI